MINYAPMIESLLAALAFPNLWFWIVVGIASIIIIACVENEHYPTPSIVAILLAIIYWNVIVSNLALTAIVVGGYAIAGAVWGVVEWFRRVQKKSAYYNEKYGSMLTDSQMEQLKAEISPTQHKALITGWIAFWPWDLFWTLTGDFFNMIYDALSGVFQNISNRALAKFSVKPPEKREVITNDEPSVRRSRSY